MTWLGRRLTQLNLHDPVESISQPVRRLRGFERVSLDLGQSTTVLVHARRERLRLLRRLGKFVVEPGAIDVYADDDSTATLTRTFQVTRGSLDRGARYSARAPRSAACVPHAATGTNPVSCLDVGRPGRLVRRGRRARRVWVAPRSSAHTCVEPVVQKDSRSAT